MRVKPLKTSLFIWLQRVVGLLLSCSFLHWFIINSRRWVWHLVFRLTQCVISKLIFVSESFRILSSVLFVHFLFILVEWWAFEVIKFITCFLLSYPLYNRPHTHTGGSVTPQLGICIFVFFNQSCTPPPTLLLWYSQLLEATNTLHYKYLYQECPTDVEVWEECEIMELIAEGIPVFFFFFNPLTLWIKGCSPYLR